MVLDVYHLVCKIRVSNSRHLFINLAPSIYNMIHETISSVPFQWEKDELLKRHVSITNGSVNSIGEVEANGSR